MEPIFIISLPRSGSTLLQTLLAVHEDISTTSEPWILLPSLYALKAGGIEAEYFHKDLVVAMQDFCENLPDGKKTYLQESARFAMRLYKKAADNNGGRYFLDKTPRYHLVIDDIMTMFPKGKFIFLFRNPLSVAASILNTWGKGKWCLYNYYIDLFQGIENLSSARSKHRDRIHCLRYEDLITDPEGELAGVSRYLGINPGEINIPDHINVSLEGSMGDKEGRDQYTNISTDSLQKWEILTCNPLRKRWAENYLKWIGKDRLKLLGYKNALLSEPLSRIPLSFNKFAGDLFWFPYGMLNMIIPLHSILRSLKKFFSGDIPSPKK